MEHESEQLKKIKEEKINRGHHTYKQYLEESLGIQKTKLILDKNNRFKVYGRD